MSLAIGIDTGGTYTDGVIYDLANKKTVAKTKVLTTYENLALGIEACLNNLKVSDYDGIKLVSLSTTLATNAIVEGRGSEVGLILIGEEPIGTLPTNHYIVIGGGHDLKGNPKEALDVAKARKALLEFKDKVDAIAISGFSSVRNPEHELQIKELVKEVLDLPIVCGHQLTTSLGFFERSVTATLNAKLLPIISKLISSIKQVLTEKGINAKLMIVKGDGTLMDEATAREKPIETILSGPAASIIGAMALTKVSDSLVLDMGGTTSDIAILNKGIPRLNHEGARVGGWLTRVHAANINTFGVGGDSHIRLGKGKEVLIGPQKVYPLSVVGERYPYLLDELELQWQNLSQLKTSQLTDCYFLLQEKVEVSLTKLEQSVLEVLNSGAHSLYYIAKILNRNPFSMDLQRLVSLGILGRAALTPTDILHADGSYTQWNIDIAKIGTNIIAKLLNSSLEDSIVQIKATIVNKLCLAIMESLLVNEGAPKDLTDSISSNFLINKILKGSNQNLFSLRTKLNVPIVGIGAPVEAYLPSVAENLNAELIIPEDSEVANALGAAAANVIVKADMLISVTPDGYALFSQQERKLFDDLDQAKEYAVEQGKRQVKLGIEGMGITEYQTTENCEDRYTNGNTGTHFETRIEITAIGKPQWK